ncbi:MAG: hypothetical protein FD187_1772 [bacterium]|nr:MAG: hypothetical protein FD142_727 [bacterium]KAF0148726.1 MAG: hypothetical protein FD187_1772 [bacterium]KAF0168216.1 MAG: hypothetical protein FD158_1609 [bacterium]
MSKAKHTPGPWSTARNRGNTGIHANAYQIGSVIGQDAQAQADAALIAVAPELLSLLVEAASMIRANIHPIQSGTSAAGLLEDIDATITKATGGTR